MHVREEIRGDLYQNRTPQAGSTAAVVNVFVQGSASDVAGLLELGGRQQRRFRFTQAPSAGAVRLRLTDRVTDKLYYANGTRVVLSTHQSAGIALYLGISRAAYLLMTSMIALTQWRVLTLNPLLRAEDFTHREPPTCAFAAQPSIPCHVLALEKRYICPACREFFCCLGAESEILALQQVMAG
jgi:hypothetical protein